ncbi:MAG: hypothetical protein MZV49_05165 [Rhodopseudomonas palustris]|nr:hypothetical protein [Rhodopseudomonas palustris]
MRCPTGSPQLIAEMPFPATNLPQELLPEPDQGAAGRLFTMKEGAMSAKGITGHQA